jgi:hypothetical protein
MSEPPPNPPEPPPIQLIEEGELPPRKPEFPPNRTIEEGEIPSSPVNEESRKKRVALLGKVLAAAIVALPGAYGALKGSTSVDASKVETVETKAKTETAVRDRQEADLQKHVAALAAEVAALRASAVTHKDLVDLVVRLRSQPHRYRRTERERELERRVEALRAKSVVADNLAVAAKVTKAGLPKLRPAAKVRRVLEQRAGF